MNLLLIFFALGFGIPTPAMAQMLTPVEYSTTTAPDIIRAYAMKEGIVSQPLIDTLYCESHFNADALHKNDGRGDSVGVAQINLYYHPEITRAEALDPFFSIRWAAEQFKQGNQHLWSCYKTANSE